MITIGGVSSAGAASTYFAKDNYYTKAQGLGVSEWFGEGAKELGLIDGVALADAQHGAGEPADMADDLQPESQEQAPVWGGEAQYLQRLEPGEELCFVSEFDDVIAQDMERLPHQDVDEFLSEETEHLRQVDAEDFKAILEGRVGEQGRVGYADKDGNWRHVHGKDMVFAPSKSVSIMALVGGDKRLTEAFQESVKATLGFAERNYAGVQDNPRQGEKTAFGTGNLVAALFTHDTSRNQDPLLHVHAVIANLTKDPRTDTWRALNKRALYKNVYSLSSLQRADFAHRVKALGYEIEPREHGNFELKVVPQAVRDIFSSRREEILQELGGKDENFKGRREATLSTRADKVELPREALTQNWRERAEARGFDAQAHIPQAQTPARGERVNNRKAVSEALAHLTYTQTTTKRGALVAAALSHPASSGKIETIEAYIDKAQKNGELVIHSVHGSSGEVHFTTEAQISAERDIQKMFKAGARARPLARSTPSLRRALAKDHIINGRPVTLNPSQFKAMHHVITSQGQYVGLQGLAGAGKTTALGVAVATLKQTTSFNPLKTTPRIIGMAPTIAASRELAEKTNGSEVTVQSYIKRHKHLIDTNRKPPRLSLQKYKGAVILHDESSMLSNQMQRDFMKINEKLGVAKVIFIGDTGQHGAVKAGPAFKMLQDFGMKTAVMDDIMRQKNPVMLEAAKAFATHDVHKGLKLLAGSINESPDYIQAAVDYYISSRTAGVETTLITMDNRTRKSVNEALRSKLAGQGHLGATEHRQPVLLPTYLSPVQAAYSENYGTGDKLEFSKDIQKSAIKAGQVWSVQRVDHGANRILIARGDERVNWELTKLEQQPFEHLREDILKLRESDHIRFKQDQKEHGIRREDVGKVTNISEKSLTVELSDNRVLDLPRDQKSTQRLDHSYTSTTYAMQGKTIEHGIGVVDPHSRAATKEAMSVMGTRSEHSLTLFTSSRDQMLSRLERDDGADRIATHAIGLTALEKAEPQRAAIAKAQEIQDRVRVQSKGRGGR